MVEVKKITSEGDQTMLRTVIPAHVTDLKTYFTQKLNPGLQMHSPYKEPNGEPDEE
jgi:hypothetical protein